jgi:hypothetical protein
LPGALGLPSTLAGYRLAHAAWLFLAGLAVFALVRRLAPGAPRLAVLASAFALTWVPLDSHRLNPLNNLQYSGATLAALLALALLLEWAAGAGAVFFAGAVLAAFVAARGYEATLGLLAPGAPCCSRPRPTVAGRRASSSGRGRRPSRPSPRRWRSRCSGRRGAPISSLAFASRSSRPASCSASRNDRVAPGPLAEAPPFWSSRLAVAAAAVAMALVASPACEGVPRRRLAWLGVAGLGLGVAAWSPLLLTPATVAPAKMQGLSAPGFGLMLAVGTLLAASLLPGRARLPATLALSCGLVALGTARTLALQREWDERSAFPVQRLLLDRLVSLAPDLREGTLVVLVDADGVFPATFTFRHAVSYLYGGRAAGLVHGGYDFLYPARFDTDGVATLPWPVVRTLARPARRYA